ncbi:MAG: hypothetical protein RLZZ516_2402 [Cyanobacteriota bacterium]|jgi:hypothetical protein
MRRNTYGVGGPSPADLDSIAAIWGRLLQSLPFGSLRSVASVHCRIEAIHGHGLTISAPTCWLPMLGQRRDLLERAASRAMGGRRLMVHLVATDAEPAGGGE